MARYKVKSPYQAYRDGKQYGWWPAGQVIDITEEEAEWVNRDSPGTLSPEKLTRAAEREPDGEPEAAGEPEAEEGAAEQPSRARKPARNRQHRPSQDRTG